MRWLTLGLVIVAFVDLSHGFIGVPVKRIHEILKEHRTRSLLCETAATNLGVVLDKGEAVFPREIPYSLIDMVNFGTGLNLDEQSVREEFLCGWEGLTLLSELDTAIHNASLDYQLTRSFYTYLLFSKELFKDYVQEVLQDPYPWTDLQEMRRYDRFITDFEAFGLADLDADVSTFVLPLLQAYFSAMGDSYEPTQAEPSTLPDDRQCAKLTNDLRLIWNKMIRQQEEWNPDASQEMRDALRNWTGFEITSHEDVQSKICQLMAEASSSGIRGVFQVFLSDGLFTHLLKRGYPEMVYGIHSLRQFLQSVLGQGYNYNYGYYNYGNYNYGSIYEYISNYTYGYNNYGNYGNYNYGSYNYGNYNYGNYYYGKKRSAGRHHQQAKKHAQKDASEKQEMKHALNKHALKEALNKHALKRSLDKQDMKHATNKHDLKHLLNTQNLKHAMNKNAQKDTVNKHTKNTNAMKRNVNKHAMNKNALKHAMNKLTMNKNAPKRALKKHVKKDSKHKRSSYSYNYPYYYYGTPYPTDYGNYGNYGNYGYYGYGYGGDYSYYNYGPSPTDEIEFMTALSDFIDNLFDMGLFQLTDDLIV